MLSAPRRVVPRYPLFTGFWFDTFFRWLFWAYLITNCTLVPTALFNCTFYLVRFLFISTSPSHDFGEVSTRFLKASERYCHNKNADLRELNILSYFEAAYDMILIVENPKPFLSWACMCAVWSALCCMLVNKKKHKVNLTP